jgi:pimeloyl-ACP methyl ester carboxylesterase
LQEQGEKYHLVLRGTSFSDLPDKDNDLEIYHKITCPVLIMSVVGDKTHPVTTAEALHKILPNSVLHIAADRESAMRDFPLFIHSFLSSLSDKLEVSK